MFFVEIYSRTFKKTKTISIKPTSLRLIPSDIVGVGLKCHYNTIENNDDLSSF